MTIISDLDLAVTPSRRIWIAEAKVNTAADRVPTLWRIVTQMNVPKLSKGQDSDEPITKGTVHLFVVAGKPLH